jgi:hypothetical protein
MNDHHKLFESLKGFSCMNKGEFSDGVEEGKEKVNHITAAILPTRRIII